MVWRDYVQRCVGEEEVGGEEETETEEEDEDKKLTVVICLGSELWCICYLVSCLTHEGKRVWYALFVLAQRFIKNFGKFILLYTHFIGHRSIRTVAMLFHPCTV